jgi:hypothetical protein
VLLGLCVIARPAAGGGQDCGAAAYDEGSKFYDLNQFADALGAFKKAYWQYEEPAFLFNIPQLHRSCNHALPSR